MVILLRIKSSELCQITIKDFLKMDVKVHEHGVFIFVHGVLLPKLCCVAASSYPEPVSGYFFVC